MAATRRKSLSYSVVSLCNHLSRSLKKKVPIEEDFTLQRNCESDAEDETAKRKVIKPRRRSSTS